MHICVFGRAGVGKKRIATVLRTHKQIRNVSTFSLDVDDMDYDLTSESKQVLTQLDSSTVVCVVVIATDGGRFLADDKEILQMFQCQTNCIVIINKSKASDVLRQRVGSVFEKSHCNLTIVFVPVIDDKDAKEGAKNESNNDLQNLLSSVLTWQTHVLMVPQSKTKRSEQLHLEMKRQKELYDQTCKEERQQQDTLKQEQEEAKKKLEAARLKVEAEELAFSRSCSTGICLFGLVYVPYLC